MQGLSAQDIRNSGYASVGDVLHNITANNMGSLSQSAPSAFAAGSAPTPAFPDQFPYVLTVPANYPGNTIGGTAALVYDFRDISPLEQTVVSTAWRAVGEIAGSVADWDLDGSTGYTRVGTRASFPHYIDFPALQDALDSGSYLVDGTRSAAELATVAPDASHTSTNKFTFVGARGTRTLMDLPGSPLALGLGADFTHRELNERFTPSFVAGSQAIGIYSSDLDVLGKYDLHEGGHLTRRHQPAEQTRPVRPADLRRARQRRAARRRAVQPVVPPGRRGQPHHHHPWWQSCFSTPRSLAIPAPEGPAATGPAKPDPALPWFSGGHSWRRRRTVTITQASVRRGDGILTAGRGCMTARRRSQRSCHERRAPNFFQETLMSTTTSATAPNWAERATALKIDGRMLIDGQRRDTQTGETFAKHSPIDARLLGPIARGAVADVDAAVRSARAAFEDGRWAGKSPAQRKKILQRFSEKILAAKDELALLETLDMGKPIKYSLAVDVPATARNIAWYAEAVDKIYDEIAPTGANALALITREPMGVIGVIVPWNYPMIMASWKLGPALASGNSVVLKPSEKSPLTALRLAELALEAGLPPGVFNVVPGYGHEAGEALALHMDVDAIGFTGSTRVGRRMYEYAGKSNLKRVYNELGGKSAFCVFEDFADVARAAKTVAGGMFFNQGESCNAPSRVLVHERIADEFVQVLASEAPNYAPADPLDAKTEMGALVDDTQLKTVLGYIEAGHAEGARVVSGGKQVRAETGGYYVEPTVFDNVANTMKIAQEEIFGPVMSVIRFKDEKEAIALANHSNYGLQASVWSDNINRAHRVARALRAGTVHVNSYDEDDITVPFGGYKQSGNGRDKSLHAFDKYTELKTTWVRIDGLK